MPAIKTNSFSKRERLCGQKRISALFNEGKGGFVFPFRYVYTIKQLHQENNPGEKTLEYGASVLISVSKRYHKRANKRNLLKRRTREAYRTSKQTFTSELFSGNISLDIALIYSTKEVLDYKVINNAVGKIIKSVQENI